MQQGGREGVKAQAQASGTKAHDTGTEQKCLSVKFRSEEIKRNGNLKTPE